MIGRRLHLDFESRSDVDIVKYGSYKYMESPEFKLLLLAYAFDDDPVKLVDLECGESWPEEFLAAVRDTSITKLARNAAFERNAIKTALGIYCPPENWIDTAVLAAQCGLPRSLEGSGEALGLEEDQAKLKDGKALIRYFCIPARPTIFINCVYEEGWTVEHAKILYQQMTDLGRWLIQSGWHDKVYVRLFEEDLFRPLPASETQNYCGGTGEMLAVDWRGVLYPCIRYMPSSLGDDAEPLETGRVVNGKVVVTEQQNRCMECLRAVTRASQSTKECLECSIAAGCAWCSAYNYQCGDVNVRQTHICWMHRARALANYEFWKEYYAFTGSDKQATCHLDPRWAAVLREPGQGGIADEH